MKYNLLIVDDDFATREESYKALLGEELSLSGVATQSAFERADLRDVHAIVVDINLNSREWGLSLFEVLERTKSRPVVLVSGKWPEDVTLGQLRHALRYAGNYNIIHTLVLGEVHSDSYIKATRTTLAFMLDRHYRRSQIALEEDESICILHLSDPQFGDRFDGEAFLVELDVGRVCAGRSVHLVAVTGDIAYSGKPSEYTWAEAWIRRLAKVLWQEDAPFEDRLLFVPGNHDFNLGVLAADDFRYSFKAKDFERRDRVGTNADHRELGLAPFRDFAFRLTGNPSYLLSPDLCWVNDSYRHLQIRFFLLNSASAISKEDPSASQVSTAFLESFTEIDDTVFSIVLVHHGAPDTVDMSAGVRPIDNWDQVRQFIKHTRTRLFVHGHGHARKAEKMEAWDETAICKTVRVMAPSTHLLPELMPRRERRGFNLITLHRKEGRVTRAEVEPFEYRDGELQSIRPRGERRFTYKFS